MNLSIRVENFRGLKKVSWAIPIGVSALVGPNGAGKSTLLWVPDLLRNAYERGLEPTLDSHGGTWGLKNLGTSEYDSIFLAIQVGDIGYEINFGIRKNLTMETVYPGNAPEFAEIKNAIFQCSAMPGHVEGGFLGTSQLLRFERDLTDQRLALRVFMDKGVLGELEKRLRPIIQALRGYRLYDRYELHPIRQNGSPSSGDRILHPNGQNVFSILRNWKLGKREGRERAEFVEQTLREIFPSLFKDFELETAGQNVIASVVTPRYNESIPHYFMPTGFMVALLHLCAVASADADGTVALDGFENELHPLAIRQLIEAFRTWSEPRGIRVLLASHSPVVLNQFNEDHEHVFVMDPAEADILPAPLDSLYQREWLQQFSLGDLLSREKIATPAKQG